MKKMNRKFLAGTAFALSAAASLAGCGACQPSVYGPPPTQMTETTEAETMDGFDVETEVQEDVYGPPEYFEE